MSIERVGFRGVTAVRKAGRLRVAFDLTRIANRIFPCLLETIQWKQPVCQNGLRVGLLLRNFMAYNDL